MVNIVEATPKDAPYIAQIRKVTWLATYVSEANGVTLEDLCSVDYDSPTAVAVEASRIERSDLRHSWIARDGEQTVGFCVARRSDVGEIESLYVLPEFQNQHIGTELITVALDWIGPFQVDVDIVSFNVDAIRFYERFGFKFVKRLAGSEELFEFPDGKLLPGVRMARLPQAIEDP